MARTTYSVEGDHAVWDGRTLRSWADVIVDRVVAEFDPVKVILFGSVANGTDGPDSDIDLLVVLDHAPPAERRRLMVALRRVTRGVAAPHDLLVTSVADLVRNSDRPGTTEYDPVRTGIALYERAAA